MKSLIDRLKEIEKKEMRFYERKTIYEARTLIERICECVSE